jgi:xylan 1,4-beta-xylosidase
MSTIRDAIRRSQSREEKWWSRGHATLVEGPTGDWWSVYRGYKNGFWTLGRQTLLAPVSWTADGWMDVGGGDLSKPLAKPSGGNAGLHGLFLSDDFRSDKYGCSGASSIHRRRKHRVCGAPTACYIWPLPGEAPSCSSPLLFIAGDQDYAFECEIDVDPGVQAGLLLFYDERLYCGLGFDPKMFTAHKYGIAHSRCANPYGRRMFLRFRNMSHIVRVHICADGKSWKRFERTFEVSGYHHNVRGGFMSLKPGLFAAGKGEARFRNLRFAVPSA